MREPIETARSVIEIQPAAAAGLEHATKLRDAFLRVVRVMQDAVAEHDVEFSIGERQREDVPDLVRDAGDLGLLDAGVRDRDTLRTPVDADDLCEPETLEGHRVSAAAATDVDDALSSGVGQVEIVALEPRAQQLGRLVEVVLR
jgi:hypothetical protein